MSAMYGAKSEGKVMTYFQGERLVFFEFDKKDRLFVVHRH